jgi:hypothetical protein
VEVIFMPRSNRQPDPTFTRLSSELPDFGELAKRLADQQFNGRPAPSTGKSRGGGRSSGRPAKAAIERKQRDILKLQEGILALGYRITPPVDWLPRARNRIRDKGLINQLNSELAKIFVTTPDARVTVSDVFSTL